MQIKKLSTRRVTIYIIFTLSIISTFGCKDQYQEGYNAGYAEGFSQAKVGVEKRCEERLEEEKNSCRSRSNSSTYSGGYSTEVCGGGGVTANGKNYEGGKTGCVRVFDDGRVIRY
jgi:hypothetical protein